MKVSFASPPSWLPWLGPPFAGWAAAVAGRLWPEAGFWGALLAALIFGFAPIIAHRVWRARSHRND